MRKSATFCGPKPMRTRLETHPLLETMVYIHTEKEELYESIERAHDTKILEKVRKMQEGSFYFFNQNHQ